MSKTLIKRYRKRSIFLGLMLVFLMVAFVRNDVININRVTDTQKEIQNKDVTISELHNQVNELTFVLDVREEQVDLLKDNTVKLEQLLSTRRIRYVPMDSTLVSMKKYKNYSK